jgi:hypothetical protein
MNQQFGFEAAPFGAYSEFEWELEEEIVPRDLPVRFRLDFARFRLEVARAIGRWTIFRSDQGRRALRLATENDKVLKAIHRDLKSLGVSDGTSLPIFADFTYEGQGAGRHVKQVTISGFMDANGAFHIYGIAP